MQWDSGLRRRRNGVGCDGEAMVRAADNKYYRKAAIVATVAGGKAVVVNIPEN
jgi:hypothetical protein